MAHINLNNDLPGIRGLMAFRPETARPLSQLAEVLLRDDNNTLSRGERELIGSYVSYLNDCMFCREVHGALAGHYLQCSMKEIGEIQRHYDQSSLPAKMKALLAIAASVQKGGKYVTEAQVLHARDAGASDREIHDAVLIAAAFCMFNRYVDGLGTWAPADQEFYVERAPRRAAEGYLDFDLNH
jgi:uncharacterized peroxidase-related enzyme